MTSPKSTAKPRVARKKPSIKIQTLPFTGKIPREKIAAAVDKVVGDRLKREAIR